MDDLVEMLRSGEDGYELAAATEIERLQKYEKLVWFIDTDYHELSYDKIKSQRDEWKKRCRKLIEEDNE